MRLFTSPALTVSEVKQWCQMVRDNKGKVALVELQLKSALNQLTQNKKAASSGKLTA
ncbi:hypothetical protein GCM10008967_00090 [Bacillus carboniphilus]|uniref:Uncharacterized protein n=1 Tax=Bacillus carboniphilus TaxID=86663 RepID=A0ABN0VNZ6_9BACI